MPPNRVSEAQNAVRMTLCQHQEDLRDLTDAFVRASDVSRRRTLEWFGMIVNKNHNRRAMRVDEAKVSSDGFMLNVTVVLDYLCEPFMAEPLAKMSRIDSDYFRRNCLVKIEDETKINADQSTSNAYYSTEFEGDCNFITELFFLNLAAHHYGAGAVLSKRANLHKDIQHFESRIVELTAQRAGSLYNPAELALLDHNLRNYKDVHNKALSLLHAMTASLFDNLMHARFLMFTRLVIVWALRLVSTTEYMPGKDFRLPLPSKQPAIFQNMPEYVIEDIVEHLKFVFKHLARLSGCVVPTQMRDIVIFCITFLQHSEYIKNPGLKAGMVTVLFYGSAEWHDRSRWQKGLLADSLTDDSFAKDHLLHALMKFYIECEHSGAHTAFYDKFNIRFEIFQIIKIIWSHDIYKTQLAQESK
jgi:ubiquitin conjugation factor E4 B